MNRKNIIRCLVLILLTFFVTHYFTLKFCTNDYKVSLRQEQSRLAVTSFSWYNNDGNDSVQNTIHEQTQELRSFEEDNIEKAYLLNKSTGAFTAGHNAVMLVDKNGRGIIFSIFSSGGNVLDTKAELRFSVLPKEKVDSFVNNNGMSTKIRDMVATDSTIQEEKYNRFAYFDITGEDGIKMYDYAVELFDNPGDYLLFSRQCDDIVTEIFKQGGIEIDSKLRPNDTYDNIDAHKWKKENEIWKTIKNYL